MFLKKTSTIFISISISQKIKIFEVLYIFNCIWNLLLLIKLKKTEISYYNRSNYIILKRGDRKIISIKQSYYIFILEFVIEFDLTILTSFYKKSTYFKILTKIRQVLI